MDRSMEKILPHRPPMVMVDGYKRLDADSAVTEKTFHADDYGLYGGWVLESVLVECMAQAVAAHCGYKNILEDEDSPPENGMLVSVDRFEFSRRVAEGSRIEIHVTRTGEVGAFKMFHGSITLEGQPVANGDLKLYVSGGE